MSMWVGKLYLILPGSRDVSIDESDFFRSLGINWE
jgi:hypothetical protein